MPDSLMDPVVPAFYKIFVNMLTFQRKLFIYIFCLNSPKHAPVRTKKVIYCKRPVGPNALPTLAVWYLCPWP